VFRRNAYGFTAGGPVIKGRTFLFGSFFRLNSSAALTEVVRAETPQFMSYLKAIFPKQRVDAYLDQRPDRVLSRYRVCYRQPTPFQLALSVARQLAERSFGDRNQHRHDPNERYR